MSNGRVPGESGTDQPGHRGSVLKSDAAHVPLAGAGALSDRLRQTHAELEASRAALAESEGRYRAIVESASDYAIVTTDLSGHLTGWSSGARRVFGWEEADVLGRTCSLIWTPEDCEAGLPEAEMRRATADGVAPDERWHVRRDGTRIWTSGQVTLLRDGAAPGFLKILRDRTAQRRAEEQLRESEERLRLIVEGARDYAIFTLDLQGRVTSWNSGAARILGWAETDIAGHDASVLYTPEDVAAGEPRAEMNSALAQGHVDGGCWMLRRNGTRFWATQTITRLQGKGGAVPGFLKILRDRTEQRLAEEALRESEARFRHMADSAPALIWMTDENGGFTFANRHFTHLFGRPAAEFRGDGWRQVVLPGDADRFDRAFMDAFHARRPFQAEVRVRDKEGEVRWLRCEGVPRFDDAGRFLGYTGCDVDITEARLAAEELERRVAARTAELSHALGQLHEQVLEREQAEEQLRQAQKMEAVGQLTGGIAHDFNNMLQGIAGSLELMQRRVAQGQAGEAARFVGAARQGVDRAAALTNRLLAFARRQALQPGPVDAGRLIRGMDELIRRTTGAAIAVDLRLHDGIGTVLCDANQLENVLLNLCINARDAMPDGGTLTIATADRVLTGADLSGHEDAKPGQYVEVGVTDTGMGMTADVLSHAFEPFFTTKPAGQGTGLGLSQLYGFVRQSGGVVRLESRPGQGTTVRLCLPWHAGAASGEPEDAGAAAEASATVAGAAGRTVLVVEDEADIRNVVTEALRELGCLVRAAEDGPAGLRILQSGGHVDLLVTDVGLPGLNGRQLADAAREHKPMLPVLLITGYAGTALDGMGLAPGMQVMGKPFTLDALAARVRTMLEAPPAR